MDIGKMQNVPNAGVGPGNFCGDRLERSFEKPAPIMWRLCGPGFDVVITELPHTIIHSCVCLIC